MKHFIELAAGKIAVIEHTFKGFPTPQQLAEHSRLYAATEAPGSGLDKALKELQAYEATPVETVVYIDGVTIYDTNGTSIHFMKLTGMDVDALAVGIKSIRDMCETMPMKLQHCLDF